MMKVTSFNLDAESGTCGYSHKMIAKAGQYSSVYLPHRIDFSGQLRIADLSINIRAAERVKRSRAIGTGAGT
jgi:hypothetical protein